MDARFRPKAGRFGVLPTFLYAKQLDAGITASSTVKIPFAIPFRKLWIARMSVSISTTLPAGGAAITAVFQKKPNGASAVALNTGFDLTTTNLVLLIPKEVPILSTVTEAQRIVNEGDSIYVDAIAAGTVTTQPVGLTFCLEAYVLE